MGLEQREGGLLAEPVQMAVPVDLSVVVVLLVCLVDDIPVEQVQDGLAMDEWGLVERLVDDEDGC